MNSANTPAPPCRTPPPRAATKPLSQRLQKPAKNESREPTQPGVAGCSIAGVHPPPSLSHPPTHIPTHTHTHTHGLGCVLFSLLVLLTTVRLSTCVPYSFIVRLSPCRCTTHPLHLPFTEIHLEGCCVPSHIHPPSCPRVRSVRSTPPHTPPVPPRTSTLPFRGSAPEREDATIAPPALATKQNEDEVRCRKCPLTPPHPTPPHPRTHIHIIQGHYFALLAPLPPPLHLSPLTPPLTHSPTFF